MVRSLSYHTSHRSRETPSRTPTLRPLSGDATTVPPQIRSASGAYGYTQINYRISVNCEVSTHILWQKAYRKLPALLNWVREHSQKGLHQELHQPLQYLWWVGRASPHCLPLQMVQSSPPSCAVVIWEAVHITLKLLWMGGWSWG